MVTQSHRIFHGFIVLYICPQGTIFPPTVCMYSIRMALSPTFWSSSSCSFSSRSRSSISLCLKYLMKLREACRPFWIAKHAASSLWKRNHKQRTISFYTCVIRDPRIWRITERECHQQTMENTAEKHYSCNRKPSG